MPCGLANQIVACHWLSMGLELESPTSGGMEKNLRKFEEITNRKKSWQ
jgi:hypothetical protein